jgi:hypothetical protein
MSDVMELLRAQQEELAAQRKLLEQQSQKIETLTQELDVLRAPDPAVSEEMVVKSEPEPEAAPQISSIHDDSAEEVAEESEVSATAGKVAQAQADDPTRDLLNSFKGAWRLPGTNAALAIGGYVKTSIVYNFDPLDTKDRFIVGGIPVGSTPGSGSEAQSSISASQSRLNFDLREPTEFGIMRAFIEGDFAGDNDTFRLRHAFGQWNRMLAGKTWSAFVDTEASPEEVDFEGLNGRINVRQSQIRLMPQIGNEYEFQVSLEDPNPQVQNGSGVTRAPDLVLTGRFHLYEQLHLKASLLGRQIRAQNNDPLFSQVEKQNAWGISLSGSFNVPKYDERDKFLFQLNAGNGIGRYVNDLNSVGEFDGIINPQDGELELFDIRAGYVSFQHWWGNDQLRSNFTFGVVEIDNPGFVPGDAYKNTMRFSSNLLWSPTQRVDLGGEYMWGRRENENGEDADATQLQMSVRYRF